MVVELDQTCLTRFSEHYFPLNRSITAPTPRTTKGFRQAVEIGFVVG